jgi:hypothetical protein
MSDELERRRELLERSANRTREHLIETLSALDHRRHELTDVKGQVRKQVHEHAAPIAIGAGAVIAALGTAIGLSIYHLATRKERIRRERWRALQRLWEHPERLARKNPPKGTLASDIGRKVVTSAMTFAAIELTKRAVKASLPTSEQTLQPAVVVRTLPA